MGARPAGIDVEFQALHAGKEGQTYSAGATKVGAMGDIHKFSEHVIDLA